MSNVRIEITATPKTAADMLEAIEEIVSGNPDSGIHFVNVVKTEPTPASPPAQAASPPAQAKVSTK